MTNLLFSQANALGKRLVMVLTMLLMLGVTKAWGETVTISGSDTWSGGQSGGGKALYITKGGITINISSGYKYSTTEIRWYSGAIMSVSSEVGNITQMKFTTSSNASEVTVPNNSSGSYSDKTWTGDSNDFTLKSTKQVKWSSVTITYTPSGGGDPIDPTTYTINWHTAVGTLVDEVLEEGATITKPATDPTMAGYVFMGWTEDCKVASDGAGFTAITNFGTATEDKDYYAVFAKATTTGGGGGSTTYAFGWETADDEDKWTISNFSNKGVYSSYKSAGSYAASTNAKETGYIQYKEKLSPTAISCKYTKATSNTNSSSQFIIQTSTNGSSWTNQAEGATMNNVTEGTFKTLSWTGSLSDVHVRIYYTGTTAVRVLDEVSITVTGGGGSITYDNYRTTCPTQPSRYLTPKYRGDSGGT